MADNQNGNDDVQLLIGNGKEDELDGINVEGRNANEQKEGKEENEKKEANDKKVAMKKSPLENEFTALRRLIFAFFLFTSIINLIILIF